MALTTRNRGELKRYFVRNAIPTQVNFEELIDGMLNQQDDGVARPPGDPLSLEAAGDATSQQKVLNLYRSFDDAAPQWMLSLNPRTNPNDPQTARPGLAIGDGAGNARLFVQAGSGFVGVGTLAPVAPLTVGGDAVVSGSVNPIYVNALHAGRPNSVLNVAEISNDTTNNKKLMIVGNRSGGAAAPGLGRRVGIWDILDVHGNLNVESQLGFFSHTGQHINLFATSYGIGIQSATQYFRTASHFAWYRGGSHSDGVLDAGGGVAVMVIAGNNVGIGTATPGARLHVAGGETLLEQENWRVVPFQNPWTNYGGSFNDAHYFKDSQGIVHLRGLVKNPSLAADAAVNGQVIFTLPIGYRPVQRELFCVYTMERAGRVDVVNNGQVIAVNAQAGWVTLDGITFRAA
jgi:hypothetical protein